MNPNISKNIFLAVILKPTKFDIKTTKGTMAMENKKPKITR